MAEVSSILKVVFAFVVVGLMVTIIVIQVRRNTESELYLNGWKFAATSDRLVLTNPEGKETLAVKDNSLGVGDLKIERSSDGVQLNDKVHGHLSFSDKYLKFGDVRISDKTGNDDNDLNGIEFKKDADDKAIALVSPESVFWPKSDTLLKIPRDGDRSSFMVWDKKHGHGIFSARDHQIQFGNTELYDNTHSDDRDSNGIIAKKHNSDGSVTDMLYLTDKALYWPEKHLMLKSEYVNSNPTFQVYDMQNKKDLFTVPEMIFNPIYRPESRTYVR